MKPAFIKSGRPLLRLLIASSIIAAFPAQANDQQEINRLKALIEELDSPCWARGGVLVPTFVS